MAGTNGSDGADKSWPELPLAEWRETYATLHMLTQVVGKIRLALTPLQNHYWNSALYLTARGLTTSAMPYGSDRFSIDFDFIDHSVVLRTGAGARRAIPLLSRPVSAFYEELTATLAALGIRVKIWTTPSEVPDPIPFELDHRHAAYDPDYAGRFWRVLCLTENVLQEFRAGYLGKCSPVHFFWGSFDLAVTRFSGRRAPERPGADVITREAYSHEVISVGFWPGGGGVDEAAFYAYAVPEPAGFRETVIRPEGAYYHSDLHEFLLPYDVVRRASDPEGALLEFCRSTYDAGADLGHWDRAALER